MMARSAYEAMAMVLHLFMENAYDAKSDTWSMNGVLPIDIFHMDAVLYPEYLAERVMEKIRKKTPLPEDTAGVAPQSSDPVFGKILQLFPNKSMKEPPPDTP